MNSVSSESLLRAPLPKPSPLPDWENLQFAFVPTDVIYQAFGDEDQQPIWQPGEYLPLDELRFSPAAAVLSYGLGIFEGLKARRVADGRVLLFRPDANAERFRSSAERLMMAPYPVEDFVEAVVEIVRRNERFVPPPGKGSFYVRPMQHADESRLGLGPCRQVRVSIYGSPVGSYFQSGSSQAGVRLKVLDQGRVAPGGTGAAKAMGNYAGAIQTAWRWRQEGFDDVLFLDALGGRWVTETSGSNFFAILADGTLVSPPLDDQILAGITRDSTLRIARDVLSMKVEERPISIDEVWSDAAELFCTGTAWTLTPIRALVHGERTRQWAETSTRDALLEILRGIQTGAREDPFGWTQTI